MVHQIVGENYYSADAASEIRSMKYASTRGGEKDVAFVDAVLRGLSADGGLLVPQDELPKEITAATVLQWHKLSYAELAFEILRLFIPPREIDDTTLRALCDKTYKTSEPSNWRAPTAEVVEIVKPENDPHDIAMLELFHGPTFAFKDCALQFLGNLFELLIQRQEEQNKAEGSSTCKSAVILGATSGDTGSAALAGVQGKQNVNALILYPQGRVSRTQELQMLSFNTNEPTGETLDVASTLTSSASNPQNQNSSMGSRIVSKERASTKASNVVLACAVKGATFDDCQAIVKSVFRDEAFVKKHNILAVNSINISRVLCQMVYYMYCYFQMNKEKLDALSSGGLLARAVQRGELPSMRFCVPTGNFGDVLAGYYCKKYFRLGNLFEFVIGSNENDILTRFMQSGRYEPAGRVRETLSPSMDIQVSSNFERFLYDVALNGGTAAHELYSAASKHSQEEDHAASKHSHQTSANGAVEVEVTARARVRQWFSEDLKNSGRFSVSISELEWAQREFAAQSVTETETVACISEVHARSQYLLCPHSAVGYHALVKQMKIDGRVMGEAEAEMGGKGPTKNVVLATAHYGKFASSLIPVLARQDALSMARLQLLETMRVSLPEPLARLDTEKDELLSKSVPLPNDAEVVRSNIVDITQFSPSIINERFAPKERGLLGSIASSFLRVDTASCLVGLQRKLALCAQGTC
ncbi:unnamed protein product [Amoebophrya sp. A25]|nr:unnamed protein product [Amoebophrya sp. A25]|eukprot:GSA25T00014926001.1